MSIDEIQGQEVISRRFPSSSADFNLFPKSRRHTDYSSPRLNHKELARLRSKAFWELHQSVAENGEGFVRRMRDYECVRSRRISDPNYRSRKRICSSNTPRNSSYMPDSDVSDDDDVQIFAGELPNDTSQLHHHSGNWVTRLDDPGLNSWPTEDGPNRSGCILPSPSPLTPHRAGQGRSVPLGPNAVASPSAFSSSLLPSPSFGQTYLISPEKIVSDLNLALANGAGSINDYGCLENPPPTDGGDPGELWQ